VSTSLRRRSSLIAALVVLFAGLFTLTRAEAALAPSTFEGDDGNLAVDTAGNKDWDSLTDVRVEHDQPTGSTDDSLKGKEDDAVAKVTAGGVQPNKSDLLNVRIAREQVSGTDFLYLAWERIPDNQGTVNIDFELNQAAKPSVPAASPSGTDWAMNRTAGDHLITFDIDQGGARPTLALLTWITAAPGTCYANGAQPPCWGNRLELNATTTPAAEGQVGRVMVGGKSSINFGEMSINLQGAGIFKSGVCTNFGSVFVKSRSSDSFTAEMSDFIAPVAETVSNCGDLTVVKNSGAYDGTFTFDVDCSGGATFDRSNEPIVTSGGTGSFQIEDIPNGTTCTVTEDSPAPQWTHTSTSPANGTVTIDGPKTVTFTNTRNFGKIVINKTAVGDNGTFEFTVSCAGITGYPKTLNVTTTNGSGSVDTGTADIPIGTTCTVSEAAKTGWSPAGQQQTVAVSAASNSVSFTNTRNMGQIVVVKNTDRLNGTFEFTVTCSGVTGYPKTLSITTANGSGTANTGTADIPTGTTCTVAETAQPGTWSTTTPTQQVVVSGASQTVTFNNTRDLGAITVNKTATGGNDTFEFVVSCPSVPGYPKTVTVTTTAGTGSANTGAADIPTGTQCTVTETAQPGKWTITSAASQNVTVTGASSSVSFTNVRDTGKIVVNKTATGGDGTFEFVVACPGVATYPVDLTVTTTNGSGSAETLSDIPTGTPCTVTETAQPSVWTITSAASQNVTVNAASVSVGFTNTRDMGRITVTKQTTGADGTFTFTVACPGVSGYPRTLSVTTTLSSGSAATPQDIPTGTTCTVTEGAQPGVWTVVGSAQQTVLVDSANENVVFSNVRNVGSLTVVIRTEGGNGTFPYTVDCTGTVFDAAGNVTTVNGTGSAPTIISIPTGSACTATQAAQPGWTLVSASPQSTVINGDETITFVNRRNVNGITIDKTSDVASANPGAPVTYTYEVKATGPDALATVTVTDDKCSPVTFVSGDTDADQLLDPGETWVYRCSNPANASEPTNIATAAGVDPAGARVEATDRVTITVVEPAVIVRPAEVLGVTLPRTGSELVEWAMLGGSFVLLGFSLVFVTRRRRTA
jgi:LPXTG-motif cell wall-anchored protein